MSGTGALDEMIATMPRGGPDASWLDRRLEIDALEYLDRDEVTDQAKQRIITMLDRVGTLTKLHERFAHAALSVVADIPSPRILELGAGHGKLSAQILQLHPTATVTVSDADPESVANIAAGALGSHPRVRTAVIDATMIDIEDDSYDLVLFALAFHHLPPAAACRAIAEATRVGKRFLVIDLKRHKPLLFVPSLVLMTLLMSIYLLLPWPWPWRWPLLHDGFISALRSYSPAAFDALGRAADPAMQVVFLPPPIRVGAPSVAAIFSRRGTNAR